MFAVAYILDPRIDVPTVYYSWNHPFPEQVLVYETEVYENGTLIHRMNVPPNIFNATCQLNSNITMCEDCYLVEVTAVNRCNQRRMNTTNIETRENGMICINYSHKTGRHRVPFVLCPLICYFSLVRR